MRMAAIHYYKFKILFIIFGRIKVLGSGLDMPLFKVKVRRLTKTAIRNYLKKKKLLSIIYASLNSLKIQLFVLSFYSHIFL